MKDPTPHEIDSMVDAMEAGGEYLDKIKQMDFGKLSYDQMMTFIEAVCTGFCDSMRLRASMAMKPIEVASNGLELKCTG